MLRIVEIEAVGRRVARKGNKGGKKGTYYLVEG